MTQALYWMTDPVPINQLASLDQWDCRKRKDTPEPACNLPNTCKIAFKPPKDGDPAWIPGTRSVRPHNDLGGVFDSHRLSSILSRLSRSQCCVIFGYNMVASFVSRIIFSPLGVL